MDYLDKHAEHITARLVSDSIFCPRSAFLKKVDKESIDNEYVLEGKHQHENTEIAVFLEKKYLGKAYFNVFLNSKDLNISSVCDAIIYRDNFAIPIERKRGSINARDSDLDQADIQIAIQAHLLREKGYTVDFGLIWYHQNRLYHEVVITDELMSKALKATEDLKKILNQERAPPVLINSKKCQRCSLYSLCLPYELSCVERQKLPNQSPKLLVPSQDKETLYFSGFGGTLCLENGRIIYSKSGNKVFEQGLEKIDSIAIFGAIQITAQTLAATMNRDIIISYHNYDGWCYGFSKGVSDTHSRARVEQSRLVMNGKGLEIVKNMIKGKISNQKTLLRRNLKSDGDTTYNNMMRLIRKASAAQSVEELLGIEGAAASIYFNNFSKMLADRVKWASDIFSECGRVKRNAQDPINACFNFLYGCLARECTIACFRCGLDPSIGLLHKLRQGRQSLALDLMEEFRPLIADSALLRALNQDQLQFDGFEMKDGRCEISESNRKVLLKNYTLRLDTECTHPLFKYSASYRRCIELQVRQLRAYFLGEVSSYVPFTTR